MVLKICTVHLKCKDVMKHDSNSKMMKQFMTFKTHGDNDIITCGLVSTA
jgi:hypothetical protein